MPNFGNLPPNYAGTQFPDGSNGAIVTLGRNNKWGYLSMIGPDNKEHTLGLISTFSITETNDSSFIPQAGSDWLELQIGSRMWRGSGSRLHVRSADLKQMMRRIYPNAQDVDFRYMPFVWKYTFSYNPPIGLPKPYEDVAWTYHKIIIVSYTNDLITGPNRMLEERFDFIGSGEVFASAGSVQYQNNQIVWAGETYNVPASSTVGTVGTGTVNQVGPLSPGNSNNPPR